MILKGRLALALMLGALLSRLERLLALYPLGHLQSLLLLQEHQSPRENLQNSGSLDRPVVVVPENANKASVRV